MATKQPTQESDTLNSRVIKALNDARLDVIQSMRVEADNPTISDIEGIHLIDCGGVIVAERLDLSLTEDSQVRQVIEELLASLKDKAFTVVIESNRNGNKSSHEKEVHATHSMLAITTTFEDLINTVYNEAVVDGEIEKAVARCVQHEKRLEVNLENGNGYKFISISTPVSQDEQ